MRKIIALLLAFLMVFSMSSTIVTQVKATSTTKIAWIYDTGFYTLSDELSHLKSLDPTKYSYDSYNQYNIDDLWAKLNDYKALLIDEDVMYDPYWTRLDGPIYNSFKAHLSQLAQWIYSGGGVFATDNNDLGASEGYSINKLKWDWLPPPLQAVSSDVGDDASGGHLHIVDQNFWLFSRPNYIDDTYINDASRGHAHGYFILSESPGYSPLIIRTDSSYYGHPVEIYTTYGSGVVVLSHAELEDGFSWEYVQNELDNVLLTAREQLVNALDLLNSTICDAIIRDTYVASYMRAVSLNVIDPYNTAFYKDLAKMLTSLLISAAFPWPPKTEFFDSNAVERLYVTFEYWKYIKYGVSTVYISGDQIAKPPFDFDSIFRDKEAYNRSTLDERIKFYYNILMNKESTFPSLGWASPDGKKFYGIDGVLSLVKSEYESFRNSIPDPLPQSFNLDFVLTYLSELRRHIFVTMTRQEKLWFYNATKPGGSLVELGALHPLCSALEEALKHFNEADMISWLAWGVPIGMTIAKWALSVPSCGASLALNLGVGIVSAAVAGYAKSQKIQYRDMVAEYLLDSIEVLGTEVFLYRAILSETTKFVNVLLTATGLNKPSVQIESLSVSNVDTEEEFGTGQGSIKIKNIGTLDASVTAMVMFYAPTPQKYVWMQMVEFGTITPESVKEVEFDYTLPRNTLLRCTEYYAEAYVIAATSQHIFSEYRFPSNPIFWVGKDCGCEAQTVLSGSLVQGQSFSTSFTSGGKLTRFTLFFTGSVIDIHIYDSKGRHIGVDYSTGQIEIQIPGAFYSGPTEIPEWILVPNSMDQQYTVKVVGVDLLEGESFSVTATEIPPIPASLTTLPTRLLDTCNVGASVNLPITLIEYGGQNGFSNVTLKSSSLMTTLGREIPADTISFSDNSFSLSAGEAKTVQVTVTVPHTAIPGEYRGNITVTTNTIIATIPITIYIPDTTPPVARAGTDRTVNVGTVVTFDASDSTDDVGIISYEWDFGDGTTGTGITTTHIYMKPGTYTVTLTVKDAAGNIDIDLITVTVLPTEPFPLWILGATVILIAIGIATVWLWRKRKQPP